MKRLISCYNGGMFEYPEEDPKQREASALKHAAWLKDQQADAIHDARVELVRKYLENPSQPLDWLPPARDGTGHGCPVGRLCHLEISMPATCSTMLLPLSSQMSTRKPK
jgi:hypothetical protein